MFTMRLLREFTVHRDAWKREPVLCDTPLMPESFHLEIHGLSAFAAFVAIIRGEDLDTPHIRALITKLTTASADLTDAEKPYSGTTTNIPPPTT